MTTSDNALDDENTHVQELKRLFLSSNVDENQCLNTAGLLILCEKLKLTDFADEIAERVLCGAEVVDFYNFKERFVAFLPEIIDVSSGTVDPLVSKAQRSVLSLGFGNVQRLSRYQTRLMCEHTDELEKLSVVDINSLFEHADSQRCGLVSIQQFLAQYRLQKRLSAEVHFIADSYVSSVNLFESLDTNQSGSIDSHDLMEEWNKSGLRIDEGLAVLKESGQPLTGPINPMLMSAYLEQQLSQSIEHSPVAVKAAIFTLHNCIDHLRYSLRESESRAEHIHKQLQLANQRRNLLIEELEHNQLSIEQGYDKRIRETEERYRARLVQMEEKFRLDKREIQNEMEQVEEELSRTRQQEVSTRNKIVLLERQNSRLNEESREQSDAIVKLEQLNRQLRAELGKVMQPRPVEDNTQLIMWKQKVDLLLAHNKRLREKLQDASASQKKRSREPSDGEALSSRWTTAFRSQLMLIKKRRMMKGDTLSEMDSEPESIFFRHRPKRRLKRKERRIRHERVAVRLARDSDDSSLNVSSRREQALLTQRLEEQLTKLRDDHKKELQHVKQTASKTLADSLNDQEKQLNMRFERERRQFEARILNEKNSLEKSFAEEKMKLMSRLQDDFDSELKRIASMVNRPDNAAMLEQFKRRIKMLESSLEGQKNGYEKRILEMKEKQRSSERASTQSYHIDKNAPNFISLLNQYRNVAPESSGSVLPYTSSRSSLGVEKRSPPAPMQPFQRSLSSFSPVCEKCDQVDSRLREVYHIMADDPTLAESGIEDIGSSAGSQSDDKIVLKREIRKLKGRLDAAKDKVNELRVLFSMGPESRSHSKSLYNRSEESGSWRRNSTHWSEETRTVELLKSKVQLLEARLSESQKLVKNVFDQYKQQLDETARLGSILNDVYPNADTPET